MKDERPFGERDREGLWTRLPMAQAIGELPLAFQIQHLLSLRLALAMKQWAVQRSITIH